MAFLVLADLVYMLRRPSVCNPQTPPLSFLGASNKA